MHSKFLYCIGISLFPLAAFAQDSTSAAADSAGTPMTMPHTGPLGMSDSTGLALYIVAIVILLFGLFLYRRSLIAKRAR